MILSISPLLLLSAAAAPPSQDAVPAPDQKSELATPVLLMAGGEPIDVAVGHAAPHMMDIDGDGLRDLLVGEFGKEPFDVERLPVAVREKWGGDFNDGRLRIYHNVGTTAAPAFEDFKYLRAGKEYASIPTT